MSKKTKKKIDPHTEDLFGDESLKTVDLFAGVGGIRMGFEQQGFRAVFSNDFEPKCKVTYDTNFGGSKLVIKDIREIRSKDLPDFDFLLGGFPCQAFSIAGYRQGFEDEQGRGNLFFEIVRILKDKKPLGFMLENVKNLQTHDNSNTFKRIQKELSALGYYFKFAVLNTMTHGNLPQNRERIFIVGFKDPKACERFNFPGPIDLKVNFRKLLDKKKPDLKYYYNNKELYARLKPFVTKLDSVYQWRRQYVRENKSGVCPTLTANMGTGGHNVPIIKDEFGIRKLTPKECSRLQGFPEAYKLPAISDAALYKQFGNSVSVTVIARIASKINEALGRKAS